MNDILWKWNKKKTILRGFVNYINIREYLDTKMRLYFDPDFRIEVGDYEPEKHIKAIISTKQTWNFLIMNLGDSLISITKKCHLPK